MGPHHEARGGRGARLDVGHAVRGPKVTSSYIPVMPFPRGPIDHACPQGGTTAGGAGVVWERATQRRWCRCVCACACTGWVGAWGTSPFGRPPLGSRSSSTSNLVGFNISTQACRSRRRGCTLRTLLLGRGASVDPDAQIQAVSGCAQRPTRTAASRVRETLCIAFVFVSQRCL